MPELIAKQRGSPGGQDGFSLVEIMVGALILVVGALAVLGVLMASSKASTSVSRQEAAINQAEKHLEWLRSIPYDRLWMNVGAPKGYPTASTDSASPYTRIIGTGTGTRYQVGDDAAREEELVTSGSTANSWQGIDYGPVSFSVAGGTAQEISGKIYTFISWRDEECPLLDLGTAGEALEDIDGALATNLGSLLTRLNQVLLPPANVTALKNALPAFRDLVDNVEAEVDALRAMPSYTGLISNGIDLCDVNDTAALEALNDIVAVRDTVLQIPAHSGDIGPLVDQLLGIVCSLLPSTCSALNVQSGEFNSDIPSLTSALNSLSDDLDDVTSYLSQPQSQQNTKRVTVAVTIDSSNPEIAPKKPIWSSTVITNPDDGLL